MKLKNILLALMISVSWMSAEMIQLKDGSAIFGNIIHKSSKTLIIDSSSLKFTVSSSYIKDVVREEVEYNIDNSVLEQASLILQLDMSPEEKAQRLQLLGKSVLPYLEFMMSNKAQLDVYEVAYSVLKVTNWRTPECFPIFCRLAQCESRKIREKSIEQMFHFPFLANVYLLIQLAHDSADFTVIEKTLLKMEKQYKHLNISVVLEKHLSSINIQRQDCHMLRLFARLAKERSVYFLEKVTNSKDDILVMGAMEALALTKTSQAAEALFNVLQNRENPVLRRKAVQCLGKTEVAKVVPQIIPFLRSEDKTLASYAYLSLRQLTGQNLPFSPMRWEGWLHYQEEIWPEIQYLLDDLFSSDDEQKIVKILYELNRYRDIRFLEDVVKFTEDESYKVRAAAYLAISKIAHRSTVPYLLYALEDESKQIADLGHRYLTQITGWKLPKDIEVWQQWWDAQPENNNDSWDAVINLLESDNKNLQYQAVVALKEQKNRSALPKMRSLLEYADSISENVIVEIIHMIRQMKDTESVDYLVELLDYSKNIKEAAHTALISITKQQIGVQKDLWYNWLEQQQ